MKKFSANDILMTLALLAIVGIVFGLWGLGTRAGRTAFDEMAGMIPGGSLIAGIALLFIVCVIAVVRRLRG